MRPCGYKVPIRECLLEVLCMGRLLVDNVIYNVIFCVGDLSDFQEDLIEGSEKKTKRNKNRFMKS